MTDYKNTPLPPMMVDMARRLDFEPKWGHVGTFQIGGTEVRDGVEVRFSLLTFSAHVGPTIARFSEIQLPVVQFDVRRRREMVVIGLLGKEVALLHHSEGDEWYAHLPKRDHYMPYAELVAKWSTYEYRHRERVALARALGVKEPALERA